MELVINKVEEYEVIPDCLKSEDKPPKFIFRTPSTADIVNFSASNDPSDILYRCFIRFENKPDIVDGNGKKYEYTTYKELVNLGASPILTEIHISCATALVNKMAEVREKGNKTVKKSK